MDRCYTVQHHANISTGDTYKGTVGTLYSVFGCEKL